MHNLYGNRKLLAPEIKGSFTLSNGMFCEWGCPTDEGLSVDVYDDSSKKLLIGLEHHIGCSAPLSKPKQVAEVLQMLLESFIDELEDSMVYYYGPRECTFKQEDWIKPTPAKTGRFAKGRS